jgi:hypothetical protein
MNSSNEPDDATAPMLPIEVSQAIERGWSVLPCRTNKIPLVRSWKEYQRRRPSLQEVAGWFENLKPPAWAVITGAVSGLVVLDFDGAPGAETMKRLGLDPHCQTPSSGFHVYLTYPGHRVATVNSKIKRQLAQDYPGLDIRGDGGYAIFHGRNEIGYYRSLRRPKPDPVGALATPRCRYCSGWGNSAMEPTVDHRSQS